MIEKVQINGKEFWIVVEPIMIHRQNRQVIPTEYFVAYYNIQEPAEESGQMFMDVAKKPKLFLSPVEALEYACEYLNAVETAR